MAPNPKPTYEFSIPSIYDDKALACRIYSLPELYFAKPEIQDYISFVGFFMYYLFGVYPEIPEAQPPSQFFPLTPILSGVPLQRPPAHIILSGYSYGALLTRYLPNVPAILGKFSRALKTSTEAEIRTRATTLATITALDVLAQPLHHYDDPSTVNDVAPLPPVTDTSSRSSETVEQRARIRKKHINALKKPFKRRIKKDSWPYQQFGDDPSEEDFIDPLDIPLPRTHYLLISLLLEPSASLVCAFRKLTKNTELDQKLLYNITLVLHGEKDKITSTEKVRRWITDIQEVSRERSKLVSVPDVGHLWNEPGDMDALKFQITKWVGQLLKDKTDLIWYPLEC
ncbi:MAG: hypothetical protein Q9194_003100 [Teloschistes cf. exilis]